MTAHITALVIGITGALTSAGSWLFAQTPGGGGDFGPWAQAGGTATAVGALAYVAKLLADGRLVAHPIAELAQASKDRDARYADLVVKHKELVQDSHEREQDLRFLLLMQERARRDAQENG